MPSNADVRVFAVTNSASDAEMIGDMLSDAYPNVIALTDVNRFVAEFERVQPQVLILAFRSIADSERHYLNLVRNNASIPPSYRTILLCTAEEVDKAYELCNKDQFDDYVMFWPLVHDATRLAMSVHLAMRAHAHTQTEGLLAKMTSQARRVADLEKQLDRQISDGVVLAQEARQSLTTARDQVGAALQDFSSRMLGDGIDDAVLVKDGDRVKAEFDRLSDEQVMPPLQSALDASEPVHDWMGNLPGALKPPLDAVRELATKLDSMQPTLLVVDDDEFMRKLLSRVLAAANYAVVAVASGHDALTALRKRPPDLIIMDVNLPDINGIEVTRRLKLTEDYAGIPVIMLTGKAEKDVIMSSRGVGAIDFVVKPFDRDVLLKKVSRGLAQ